MKARMKTRMKGGMKRTVLAIAAAAILGIGVGTPSAVAQSGEGCLPAVQKATKEIMEMIQPFLNPGAMKGFNPQPEPPGHQLRPGEAKGFDPQPDPPKLKGLIGLLRNAYHNGVQKGGKQSSELERLIGQMELKLRQFEKSTTPAMAAQILKSIMLDAEKIMQM
ncbi:MAG: hypothetical protein IPM61_00925 [Chlorobi bacterium]|nr:MAG: hypothetical protein UZ07_CHB004001347 [Chlorobi bacterium OLB7]MBK8909870.1 hypothetical protein [Chlorobiota bacterium]MBX7215622.1 hypothetical protein [Candidatus Kapabacteria bacterium]